jgi:hypothetical protein
LVGGEGFAVDASMIKADANRQRSAPGSEWQAPEAANHAVREYLAVLDDAAFGAATPVVPKFVSPADPASRWTGANGGLAFFAYCTNYLIDTSSAPSDDRSHGRRRSERRRRPTALRSKCPGNGYVDAAAGFRRHSIAAAAASTMATANNPTIINHSTDPSC